MGLSLMIASGFEANGAAPSNSNAERVVRALQSIYVREGKVTDKEYFVACQRQWLIELVMNHERDVAMGGIVPDDGLVDIE